MKLSGNPNVEKVEDLMFLPYTDCQIFLIT